MTDTSVYEKPDSLLCRESSADHFFLGRRRPGLALFSFPGLGFSSKHIPGNVGVGRVDPAFAEPDVGQCRGSFSQRLFAELSPP